MAPVLILVSLQLLGMHALSGYDTTSYPYGKGMVSLLNTIMVSGNYQGFATIDDVGTTHTELVNTVMLIFVAFYSQQTGTSLESACYNIFRKKRNPKAMALPQTSANLTQHNILGLIFKISHVVESSAYKKVLQGSQINITYFVCEFRDEIYLPVIAEGDPAPPDLLDVTQCQSTV